MDKETKSHISRINAKSIIKAIFGSLFKQTLLKIHLEKLTQYFVACKRVSHAVACVTVPP